MEYKNLCKDDTVYSTMEGSLVLYETFCLGSRVCTQGNTLLATKEIIGRSAPILKPPWLLLKNPLPGVDARNVWIAPRGSRK
jgi:hypothetical protein